MLKYFNLLRVDRYFWLTVIFASYSYGMVLVGASRTWGNIVYGLSPIASNHSGTFLGLGLIFLLFAQGGIVWLGDLDRGRPIWMWGMVAVTVLWGTCTYLIAA